MDKDSNLHLCRKFIYEYLRALDTPRALTVWLLYSCDEHEQLVDLAFDALAYNNIVDARDALAATSLLSKATFLNLERDKRKIALDKFVDCEAVCKETNENITQSRGFMNPLTDSVLLGMSRKIERILGDFDADEFVDACNWGPGATTLIRRRDATHPTKFQLEAGITAEAYDFVEPWFRSAYPSWEVKWNLSAGFSKIVTVPKNAKTDRTIAIEPGINLWFQKGIGTMLRRRLLREGIDLNDQSHNQKLSRLASKFNHLATIDFSSASDTIARRLVECIIPPRWLVLLDRFRSSVATLDGTFITLSKFSSMGNGFTFELESLIFLTMAQALLDVRRESGVVSIYGDDLIVPSSIFDDLQSVSKDLGFTFNKKKSYSSGYYRESCGSHWWNGVDIKPIFLKEPLNATACLLKTANNVRRLAHRRNYFGCDRALRRCWELLASALGPKCPRLSDGFGDVGLIVNFDEPYVTAVRAKHQYEGFFVRVWAALPYEKYIEEHGLLLSKLRAMGPPSSHLLYSYIDEKLMEIGHGNLTPYPGRTKLAKIRLLVPRWYDLGPWC